MATKQEKGDALASSIESESRKQTPITVKAPNIQTIVLHIMGTAPYVQHKFSQKSVEQIRATQEAGTTAKSKKARQPKDFEENCRNATYFSRQGWIGMPATAFRKAMISACRLVGFKMTMAKLAVFTKADGFDKFDGTPLVRIYGKHRTDVRPARNDNGSVDLRARPMWDEGGWVARVQIRFDADTFTPTDITNLMMRVGMQVGIGEGRNDSKDSAGIGWGDFDLIDEDTFKRFVADQEAA